MWEHHKKQDPAPRGRCPREPLGDERRGRRWRMRRELWPGYRMSANIHTCGLRTTAPANRKNRASRLPRFRRQASTPRSQAGNSGWRRWATSSRRATMGHQASRDDSNHVEARTVSELKPNRRQTHYRQLSTRSAHAFARKRHDAGPAPKKTKTMTSSNNSPPWSTFAAPQTQTPSTRCGGPRHRSTISRNAAHRRTTSCAGALPAPTLQNDAAM